MSSTQAKPEYRAYESGVEISIPANGERDRWYVLANGKLIATITEWADGFTVDGEVNEEIRSFIAECQAANRAALAPATVKENLTVASKPATAAPAIEKRPAALRGLRIVSKNQHEFRARAEKVERLAKALAGHISAADAAIMDENCWRMAAQIARVAVPSAETRQAVIAALSA